MTETEIQIDPQAAGRRRRRLLGGRGRGRAALGAGAVALTLAVAGCGGDDDDATTTGAAVSTTATQPSTTGAETTAQADNGIAGKSAAEVLRTAQEAAAAASAVRVAGDVDDVRLDMSLVRGEGAKGSMAQGDNEFEIVAVDGDVYLKGSDAFYEQIAGRAGVQLLGGKWLQVPADDDDFGGISQLADMDQLLRAALKPDSSDISKGEVETVDGVRAVPLTSGKGTLYVAAEGDPLPLQIAGGRSRPGKVTFSGWNEPVELTAPEDAVDVGELQRSRAP